MTTTPMTPPSATQDASRKKSQSTGVVHTMPEEFFSAKQRLSDNQTKKGSKALFIGLVSLAVILIVVTVSLWLYMRSADNASDNTSYNDAVLENVDTNTDTDANVNDRPPIGLTSNVNDVANINTSINNNADTNTDTNTNTDTKSNANGNSHVNDSGNTTSFLPPSTTDTDGDALTDKEELLYGTLANKPDTDEDSYVDGHEVIHLYSPLAATSTSLLDGGLTALYTNTLHHYSIQYPDSWVVDTTSDAETEVLFTSDTGEFVEVLVEDNLALLTPAQWYERQFGNFPELQSFTELAINGVDAVLGADGATVYIADADKMYLIHYNFGIRDDVNFATTYTMMYSSFRLLADEDENPVDDNLNVNSGV